MSKLLAYYLQRFSLHDGHGIRSTLFLKGCPLTCHWCQNPESQSFQPEMSFNIHNCIGCGECYNICDYNSIDLDGGDDRIIFDNCVSCGDCEEVCPQGAIEKIGWEVLDEQELVAEILKDSNTRLFSL